MVLPSDHAVTERLCLSIPYLVLVGLCLFPVWCSMSLFADIDECVNNTVCDSHGFCDNTAGSFRCLCYQGFQAPQDGQGCVGEFSVFVLSSPLLSYFMHLFQKKWTLSKVGELKQGTFHHGLIFNHRIRDCRKYMSFDLRRGQER